MFLFLNLLTKVDPMAFTQSHVTGDVSHSSSLILLVMATSSSDESCSAPTDFDISSSLEDSNGRCSLACERCPLCRKPKRTYYCKDCIRNGDFTHSFSRCPERFAEKKLRLFQITRDKVLALDQIDKLYKPKLETDNLKFEIASCQERIRLLRLVIKETKDSATRVEDEVIQNEAEIEEKKAIGKQLSEKLQEMQRYKAHYTSNIDELTERLNTCRNELRSTVRENVDNLVRLIFPVIRVSTEDSQEDSLTEDTVTALADATRTAYVKGRWIYNDNSSDIQFKIVEPLLPGNGDYSAYNTWVTSNKESVPTATSELGHNNAAAAISAALTYTCQLVSILAFYLDVWLPKKLCYSEFCSHELSEQDFAYKVAKLNANLLHLCLSQNVNPDHLHPRHTAANLMLLLDPKTCDLGRYGPFEVNAEVMRSMEESLLQDLDASAASDDDESPGELDGLSEWETIMEPIPVPSRVTVSAMPNVPQVRTRQPLPSEAATSVAGGLVMSAAASVVSLWRGAFGHK